MTRTEYQLVSFSTDILKCNFIYLNVYDKVNVDDGFLNLMTQEGVSKDDVKVPEGELGQQISTDFEEGKDLLVTIVSAMGEEQVIEQSAVVLC